MINYADKLEAMNRGKYYDYIDEKLSVLTYRIKNRGKLNILDFHLHSENFYLYFLNKLYGWNLDNLNSKRQNVEAIDLIDNNNKFIVQVSATASKQKIESSLSKSSLKDYIGYQFKFIAIAGEGKDLIRKLDKGFENPNNIPFNPNEDIFDYHSILNQILGKDIDELEDLFNFIRKELGEKVSPNKIQSLLPKLVRILADKYLEEDGEVETNKTFQIMDKISFNDLESKYSLIREYAFYGNILDKIYKSFIEGGKNKSLIILSIIKKLYIKISGDSQMSSEHIFDDICADLIKRVVREANEEDNLSIEEVEICIDIIVVDAFMRCKIFKNPENYSYAPA